MSDQYKGNWNLAFQRAGAAFAGRGAEDDAARAQQEDALFNRQLREDELALKREERNKALSQERLIAMAQDAQTAGQFLEMGETDKALQLLDSRLGMINQLGGDPSDTQEIRDMIAAGKVDEAAREINLFTTAAVNRGLIKSLSQPEAKSTPGKQAQDEGLKPGTLAFAARVQELAATPAAQPRMVEQGGIQYWAEGPNAGKPVVAGAQGPKKTIAQEYEESTGAGIPAGMMPVRDRSQPSGWTLKPQTGTDKDPAVMAPQEKVALDTTTQFYDNAIAQINKVLTNPQTKDVVGGWEGTFEPMGLISPQNRQAFSDIESLSDMLQVQGLQMMRDASKTGGAVGQVTEKEWPKLSARFGNLRRDQKQSQYFEGLKSIKDDLVAAKQNTMDAYTQKYGNVEQASDPLGIR
jgi:hypothetical protein